MESWYNAHADHPYPNAQEASAMSTAGGITEEQVIIVTFQHDS